MGLASIRQLLQLLSEYIEGLVPGDTLEFPLTTVTYPLHRVKQPIWRVLRGNPRHSLDTGLAVCLWIAPDFLYPPILNAREDGAFSLALIAGSWNPR